MKLYYTLALIFITGISFSQEFEISGKIVDEEGTPLGSATIYAETLADSSLVNYTISGSDGSFSFSGSTEEDSIALSVSYTGLQPYREILRVQEQMQLDPIILRVADTELDEVLVTATRSPITLKKDTLEFNAQSFQTRPDANLEELMEQLPGVEVDSEGNITVNGRPVTRFLVNGEEFFGDDHRIATKNLPKEIIEKIQVMDTKTEEQEFTGEEGDPDNKTVNITIQEDKNKGYFARATAGGGTDERYEMSGIANYFKDEFRISALASSNNINSSGFSYDEVYGMMGRSAGRSVFGGGGGGGITKSETAGVNFTNEWDEMDNWEEIELSGDYFFGRNDTERRSVVSREYFLPDSTYFTNSEDRSTLVNDSHRANLDFEIELDTLTRISISPRFNANYGNSNRSSVAESLSEEGELVNNTQTFENEDLARENFSNEIDFIKRFGARGAFFGAEFSNDHGRQRNDNFYYSEIRFFEEGEEVVEIQDQYIDEDEQTDQYNLELDQRSVLADQLFLDISYDLDYEHSTNKRYVYEAEDGDGNYGDEPNPLLSNDFEVISTRHTPRAGLNYDGDLWRINTEVGLHHTTLENENFMEETAFDNTYNNLLIDARVRYEVERSREISLRYNTDVDIPSIYQLQPLVDRTNPLHIRQGNPGLRPTYRQNIGLNFRNYDYSTRTGYYSWMDFSTTDNQVVSVTRVGQDLVRNTTYTNVDGAMSAGIGGSYNKRIEGEGSEFRYNLRFYGSYNRNVGFINDRKYNADRYSLNPSIRFTYAIDEVFEINPRYSLDYSSISYDISADRDEEVTNHQVGLRATSYWPENVIFGNDLTYNYFGQVTPGFDNSAILWNMSLGYQFLDDNATVKVQVYDLLDQNVDTRRTIGDDYIQDAQSLILTRYAMLSFTYKINNIGGNTRGRGRRGR